MSIENAVREAAAALHATIVAAEAEGYRVAWPLTAAGLPAIAISETGKMKRPAAAAPNTKAPAALARSTRPSADKAD